MGATESRRSSFDTPTQSLHSSLAIGVAPGPLGRQCSEIARPAPDQRGAGSRPTRIFLTRNSHAAPGSRPHEYLGIVHAPPSPHEVPHNVATAARVRCRGIRVAG